jgi:hypothetical protein
VHRWVSMPSSTCSGSKRSNKTNGTSDQRQAREVKHPLACAIGSAIAAVWLVFKFQCTNDWVLLRNVANVWITNLGWPVVPEVVRSTAGAFVSILYCFHNESVSVGRVAGGYTGWRRVDSSMILLLELPEKQS